MRKGEGSPQPAQLRKVLRTAYADIRLGAQRGSRTKIRVIGLALIFLVCGLAAWGLWFGIRQRDVREELMEVSQRSVCPCPDVTSKKLMGSATFAVRARLKGFSSDHTYAVFDTTEMYLGPASLIRMDVAVSIRDLQMCKYPGYTESDSDNDSPRNWFEQHLHHFELRTSYLLIANYTEQVTLTLGKSAKQEENERRRKPKQHIRLLPFKCGAVVMAAWDSLPRRMQEVIQKETDANRDLWWRHETVDVRPKNAVQTTEWWVEDGITVIAACMDRGDHVAEAVKSWTAAEGVSEIVIIDWNSKKSLRGMLKKRTAHLADDPRVKVFRVKDESRWVLARAFNAGIRLTTKDKVLKADCDTAVSEDFFRAHPLQAGEFYAGDWRNMTDKHANGVLYAYRHDLLAINGYDERIKTYGWDDSDIATRLFTDLNLHDLQFDDSKLRHLEHAGTLRMQRHEDLSLVDKDNLLGPAIEVQRNRIMLTRMSVEHWSNKFKPTFYNVEKAASIRGPNHVNLLAATEVKSLTEYLSSDEVEDASKRAIRIILSRNASVEPLPKTNSLDFFKELANIYGRPEGYAHFQVALDGTLAERLLSLASTIALSRTDDGSGKRYHFQYLWVAPTDNYRCNMTSILNVKDLELIEVDNMERFGNFTEIRNVSAFQSMAVLGETSKIKIRCGIPTHYEMQDQTRKVLQSFAPTEFSSSLIQKLRPALIENNQEHNATKTAPWEVVGDEFASQWRGKLEEEGYRKTLYHCDPGRAKTRDIYEQYPELALITAAILKSRIRCLYKN